MDYRFYRMTFHGKYRYGRCILTSQLADLRHHELFWRAGKGERTRISDTTVLDVAEKARKTGQEKGRRRRKVGRWIPRFGLLIRRASVCRLLDSD
ncbi:unnamed protein product, partial [Nesidiocoris tenuis]